MTKRRPRVTPLAFAVQPGYAGDNRVGRPLPRTAIDGCSPDDYEDQNDADDRIQILAAGEEAQAGDPTSVYLMFAADHRLLYVGITRNLPMRTKTHGREKQWWHEVSYTLHEHYRNRRTAARREAYLIRVLRPVHNKAAPRFTLWVGDELGRLMDDYHRTWGRPPSPWVAPYDLPLAPEGSLYEVWRRIEGSPIRSRFGWSATADITAPFMAPAS